MMDTFSGKRSLREKSKSFKKVGKRSTISQLFEYGDEVNYPKNKIPFGIDEFGDVLYIDLKGSSHMLIIGPTGAGKTWQNRGAFNRFYEANENNNVVILTDLKPEYHCLNKQTKILTAEGMKRLFEFDLGNIIRTLSYDFLNDEIVESKSKVVKKDEEIVYEIELENGKIIEATSEHKFFVRRNGKIEEVKLKNLNIDDEIVETDNNILETTKIKSIKRKGKKEVIDLNTPKYENFILGNGVVSHNSSAGGPLQKKFQKWLCDQPREKPKTYPVKNYRPRFLQKMGRGEELEKQIPFQLPLDELTVDDLRTILDFNDLSDNQENLFREAWFNFKEEGNIKSFSEMKDWIEANPEYGDSTKRVLKNRLSMIEKNQIIGDRFTDFHPIADIKRGKIPCLNLSGWEDVPDYSSAYLAVIARKIYSAKKSGKLPKNRKLLIICDEVNKFAPNSGNPVSKEELNSLTELARSEGISLIMSTQYPYRVSETIYENVRYILISHLTGMDTLKKIVKDKIPSKFDTHPFKFNRQIRDEFGYMKEYQSGQRDWLLIDTSKNTTDIFQPFAPLSKHKEAKA